MSFDRVFVLSPDEVRPTRIDLQPFYSVKALASDTDGAFTMRVTEARRDIRRHTHLRVDETFYLLEGEVEVSFGAGGSDVYHVTPGTYVFMPRGVPHALKLLTDTIKMVAISTPGGDESYLEDIVETTQRLGRKDDTSPEYIEMARRHDIIFAE
jgi:quercetin dioxygenase-like cupin family protein